MGSPGSPLTRRQLSRETENPASIYSRYITSCYARHLAASPYYQQLLDYLQAGADHGSTPLQTPQYYELKRKALLSGSLIDSGLSNPRRRPSIVVLNGFPSPECISAIGAKEKVRPELFIGHLDFTRGPSSSRKFFELPSLPSDRHNIIHVRLISMGQSMTGDTRLRSHVQSRIRADDRCAHIENQLFCKRQYGATRIRKVHIHNTRMFSVEQVVSFSVTQREKEPWCGVFLVDRGKCLQGQHNLPWLDYIGGARGHPNFVPILPYNISVSETDSRAADGVVGNANTSSSHLYHPINDLFVQEEGDLELLRQDPFFILSRLFSFAARSWSLVLNYLVEDIQICAACSTVDEEQLSAALEQLRFNSGLITRIEGFLAENQHVIEERGDPSWPKASDTSLERRVVNVQASLNKDYILLVRRCAQLASRCKVSSGTLVSAMQLLEAQKGINQARQVHDLTKLAFIFVPLNLVASIFGMNVSIFKDYPPIWSYFAIAVPLTAICWFGSGMLGVDRHRILHFFTRQLLGRKKLNRSIV